MEKQKRKILVLVEGAKADVALMERLLSVYEIDFKYEIISYWYEYLHAASRDV